MSLRVHVKTCASVCEKDTLVCSDVSVNTSLTFSYPNMRVSKCNVFKLREVPKAFDTTMVPPGTFSLARGSIVRYALEPQGNLVKVFTDEFIVVIT